MKILQLIQKPQLRGAEIFASQLSEHLKAAGHEVLLVTLYDGNARLPYTGSKLHLKRSIRWRMLDFFGWKEMAKLVTDFNPDIIQANAADTLKFAVFSKLLFRWKKPIIYRNANKMSEFIHSKLNFFLNSFLVSRLSLVISVSELCRQDFIKCFNYPANMARTCTIGTELKEIDKVDGELINIFPGRPVFVNVASLVPEKNHRGLLSIFQQIKKRHNAARLIILGKGKEEKFLKSRAAEIGISDSVYFLGYKENVLPIVEACTALIMPSYVEGLPGAILEAQYCKTPVVAYDVGGISEVVKDGCTGWLIQKGDESNFVQAVDEIVSGDSIKINGIVERAFEQVVNEYDNKLVAQKFLDLYQEVIEKDN